MDLDPIEAAVARFREFLQSRELRMTEVREAIVRSAALRGDHFSVEDLVDEVKKAGLDASVASVYRAMPLLIDAGLIKPAEVSGDRRAYEVVFGREHHDHLICSTCGTVVEFQFEAFAILEREIAAQHEFTLTSHVHELIGVCKACRRADGHRG